MKILRKALTVALLLSCAKVFAASLSETQTAEARCPEALDAFFKFHAHQTTSSATEALAQVLSCIHPSDYAIALVIAKKYHAPHSSVTTPAAIEVVSTYDKLTVTEGQVTVMVPGKSTVAVSVEDDIQKMAVTPNTSSLEQEVAPVVTIAAPADPLEQASHQAPVIVDISKDVVAVAVVSTGKPTSVTITSTPAQ